MSGDLVTYAPKQIELIRNTLAADCEGMEFDLFMAVAKRTGLDPFRRQIYAVVYNKKDPKKRKMSIITGIDGFRAIAARTGNYRPDDDEPEIIIDEAKRGENNPAGIVRARVKVWQFNRGWFPVIGTARWDEYVPLRPKFKKIKGEDGEKDRFEPSGEFWPLDKTSNWHRMPHVMIAKVAEAQALRKAFPECAGVYAEEEMAQAQALDAGELASETVERLEREERLRISGVANAIMMTFDAAGTLEPVPLGQVADRIMAHIGSVETVKDLGDWWERNRHPWREFWARSKADALAVKKAVEARRDELSARAATKAEALSEMAADDAANGRL